MKKKQLIEIADSLGISHYNECDAYICLEGINGDASILYTDEVKDKSATMLDFAKHLKQMGRDSLKMELAELLDITRHA